MRPFAMLVLTVALLGCISPPDSGDDMGAKSHFSLSLDELRLESGSLILGSKFPVHVKSSSESQDGEYIISIYLGGDEVYREYLKGNFSGTVWVPATSDGTSNLTANVFFADTRSFIDIDSSDNSKVVEATVLPMASFTEVRTGNSTRAYDNKRSLAVPIVLDGKANVQTVAMHLRVSAQTNASAPVRFSIHKDLNGTPGEIIMEWERPVSLFSYHWRMVFIPFRKRMLEPGTYWIQVFAGEGAFTEILCSPENEWPAFEVMGGRLVEGECRPYILASSLNYVDSMKEYYAILKATGDAP